MNVKNLFMELYKEKYGEHINQELAKSIVYDFAVTDGSERESGEKWSMEETKSVGDKLGIDWEKINKCEWYVVMNMMYSDYYRTAKKHGLADPSFFAELSYDWFTDKDGAKDKTFRYFLG